ncbi:MAG: glycoside hydrolase family 43 protein [Oscillospiraceae bacterium]|jgi:alpha-N-arabinofuranosidase|nr:glycoside hydrolase family 43 protein [Oscillospiraceae bacterium]
MKYKNPIIPGFYPDSSICRKGEDYYLVASSFEYFPGVPIFHSKDLVNWEQIGNCLTRKSQLNLENVESSAGIYAPTIRYNPHDDLFYMVTTNVSNIGNFYVYAKEPSGEWSEPILVEQDGIDPSLFFDDEGVAHFISNSRDANVEKAGFRMAPIDIKTGKFLKPPMPLWGGIGSYAPEAPHIYQANGWFYQLIAEGGTEINHMVTIARSRELYGNYEPCPFNPILTHRDKKWHFIQAVGHADLVEDGNGNWWAVFLGVRITQSFFHHLGREVFLAPVNWADDWPIINAGKLIEIDMEVNINDNIIQNRKTEYKTDFRTGISHEWVHLRNPLDGSYRHDENGLYLTGNALTLTDEANPAFVGFRQRDLDSLIEIDMEFTPKADCEEAGVTVFYKYDSHFDFYISKQDKTTYLSLRKVVGDITHIQSKIPVNSNEVTLKIKSDRLKYYFYAIIEGVEIFVGEALTRFVSKEANTRAFTGTLYALYATGNGRLSSSEARFIRFLYQGND